MQGRADELLSLLCLARPRDRVPLLLAPAMNREMWGHPATQRNLAQVARDGATVLGVGFGDQACGETGDGRMLEAAEILEELEAFFTPQLLTGQHVLITAGPTFEAIDPVRGITNLSSGKMGFAIARAARAAGAQVTLVAGPVHLPTPRGVRRIDVRTAQQMHAAVGAHLDAHPRAVDVFISVAAVADWRVANASNSKLKKTADGAPPQLQFAQNPDILAGVAARPDAPYCVGFAAESEDLERHGQEKRERKGVPLLVANIGHETFGMDDNELLLIDAAGSHRLPRASKTELAAALVGELAARLPHPARS